MKMRIDTSRGEDQEKVSLIHEILHCIEQYLGVELTESLVEGIAMNLYAVLKQNPLLLDYLKANRGEEE